MQVSNLNFDFGDFGRLGEVIKKLFNSVLSAHILRVHAKFGVCCSDGFRETLSEHDRQTDGHGLIYVSRSADQKFIYAAMRAKVA